MAKFSVAAAEKRKVEELVPVITERVELFKRFRANGWDVRAVTPVAREGAFTFNLLPDDYRSREVHFRVKMPGAAPVLARSIYQLLRFAKGLK